MSIPTTCSRATTHIGFPSVSEQSGAVEASHLYANSKGKRLFSLNAVTVDGSTYYAWVMDSYTACTPGTQAATVNVNTEQLVLTGAQSTWTTGTRCRFTTTGGLPSPIAPNTDYWLVLDNGVTYKLATSLDNALAGTCIDFTTAGSGTLTVNVQQAPVQYLKLTQDVIAPLSYNAGRAFNDGIYVAVSSTRPATFTAAPSANCLFDLVRSP